jgi:hypothetical protein
VPLAPGYRGPDALPTDGPLAALAVHDLPFEVTGATEARDRARFVVRRVSVPSVADPETSIEFEYYDVEGDARTPVIVLLPIFSGAPAIPRFFARYFANQGWAAVVVQRHAIRSPCPGGRRRRACNSKTTVGSLIGRARARDRLVAPRPFA